MLCLEKVNTSLALKTKEKKTLEVKRPTNRISDLIDCYTSLYSIPD